MVTETMAWEYTEVKEVFATEQDAKRCVGDFEATLGDEQPESMSYGPEPRELRTEWKG